MAYALKLGSKIKAEIYLNDDYTDLEVNRVMATYTGEVTGLGPAQNGDVSKVVETTILSSDTASQIAVKVKTAVDGAITAG